MVLRVAEGCFRDSKRLNGFGYGFSMAWSLKSPGRTATEILTALVYHVFDITFVLVVFPAAQWSVEDRTALTVSVYDCESLIKQEALALLTKLSPFLFFLFLLLEIVQFLHAFDVLQLECLLCLPGVVDMGPVLPLYQILDLTSLFVGIEVGIGVPVCFYSIYSSCTSRCCRKEVKEYTVTFIYIYLELG